MRRGAILLVVLSLLALPLATPVEAAGGATPKWIAGTWSSLAVIPPNPILGNEEDLYLPELDTFTGFGAIVSTGAASVLPLTVDGEPYLVSAGASHGNWVYLGGGKMAMTQWRFMSDAMTFEPLWYLRITVDFTFDGKASAAGPFRAELLELDLVTPVLSDGVPVVVEGAVSMFPLGVVPY